jgi:amphi-Trp domain-containing protein
VGGVAHNLSVIVKLWETGSLVSSGLAYARDRAYEQAEGVVARQSRDVERIYETDELVAKLRRLADAIEAGSPFRIQIAGERIRVPARAQFSIEHERGDDEEEIEFQFKWALETEPISATDDEPMV